MRAGAHMSLARDITTVGSGTLVSRLLAYFRDAAIAALLGAGPFAEAFFAVMQVVNFFRRLLAESALNGAFVPLWLRLAGGEDGAANANRFTARVFVAVGCITGAIALLVALLAKFVMAAIVPGFDEGLRDLAAFYLLIVALYIVLAGLVAVLAAALNAQGRVAAVAASTALFNFVLLLALALAFALHIEYYFIGIWLSVTIVIAGSVQFIVTGTAWLLSGRRFQRVGAPARDETGTFFKRVLPSLIATGVPQLKLIAATAIVSSTPAAVSWLYYANRLYELPLGIAAVGIAAVMVPHIAAAKRTGSDEAFSEAQSRACEVALALALPAATAFALLASQIAGGLFQHGAFAARDTEAVAVALIAICSGLPGHVLEKVFGAVSFAHEDTQTPMLTALCALAATIVGGVLLFPRYGYIGVAAAIAISGWVGAALLGGILRARGWLRLDADAKRRLPRIVAATVAMGVAISAAIFVSRAFFPALAASALGRLELLVVLVVLGLVVYAAALEIFGVAKLKQMIAALPRRT